MKPVQVIIGVLVAVLIGVLAWQTYMDSTSDYERNFKRGVDDSQVGRKVKVNPGEKVEKAAPPTADTAAAAADAPAADAPAAAAEEKAEPAAAPAEKAEAPAEKPAEPAPAEK